MLQDAVVHGVEVLHVEGGEGQGALELLGEEALPGVVAHKHQTFPYEDGDHTGGVVIYLLFICQPH